MSEKGKIFVIDGLDGCGKSTQLALAEKRLSEAGQDFITVSFPDYKSNSSAPVRMYLAGEIAPNAEDINAYAASSFYAVDRYISYKTSWEKDYLSGKTVICARYVSSNAIHQMTKLPEFEWEGFLHWICDYEYDKLGIPRADKVIFLDMPTEVSQKLLSGRYKGDESKKDIHEANTDYLRRCRKAALFAAEIMGWSVIPCSENGEPLPVNVISDKIMSILLS